MNKFLLLAILALTACSTAPRHTATPAAAPVVAAQTAVPQGQPPSVSDTVAAGAAPAAQSGASVQALPTGTSTQPGNVAATAPLPYQSFGSIAQVSPSYVDPANATN